VSDCGSQALAPAPRSARAGFRPRSSSRRPRRVRRGAGSQASRGRTGAPVLAGRQRRFDRRARDRFADEAFDLGDGGERALSRLLPRHRADHFGDHLQDDHVAAKGVRGRVGQHCAEERPGSSAPGPQSLRLRHAMRLCDFSRRVRMCSLGLPQEYPQDVEVYGRQLLTNEGSTPSWTSRFNLVARRDSTPKMTYGRACLAQDRSAKSGK
jgi:hypothetical protein